jgi:hypothetical protein
MRRLVIHIGMHKTGSSSIQATLQANAGTLAQAGVRVFRLHENHSAPIVALFSRQPDRFSALRHYRLDRGWRLRVYRLLVAAALRRSLRARGDTLIVSGEDIGLLSSDEMRGLRDWVSPYVDEVLVYGFVRSPMSFANSAAQQRLRGGAALREIVEKPPLPDYRRRFSGAIDAFGLERMRLRAWQPSEFVNGDSVLTFLHDIGLPETTCARLHIARRNEGLTATAAEMLDAANRCVPIHREGAHNPLRALTLTGHLSALPGPPFDLGGDALERVSRDAADDTAWMEKQIERPLAAVDRPASTSAKPAEPAGPETDCRAVLRINARLRRRERLNPGTLVRRLVVYGVASELAALTGNPWRRIMATSARD